MPHADLPFASFFWDSSICMAAGELAPLVQMVEEAYVQEPLWGVPTTLDAASSPTSPHAGGHKGLTLQVAPLWYCH